VTGGGGTIDAAAYRSMAAQMSQDAGIAYRYGPSPADYGTTGNSGFPEHPKRADTAYVSDSAGGSRPCLPPHCGTWQVGTWVDNVGPYSSNAGHAAFVADNPSQRAGVSLLAISSVSNSVFSQRPELPWMFYGGGLDDVNAVQYLQQGREARQPVAMARCEGRPGWCVGTIAVFQNGLIATLGNNTARNLATAQLAPGKVPTAVALTNSSEFALVTVWDTVNLRGEVAVVALAGLGHDATVENPDVGDWWGEWRAAYPGLPNLGNTAFMKILGYVPLPDMAAPTEIAATTGLDRNAYLPAGIPGRESPGNLTLSNESNRQSFTAGQRHAGTYAKTGVAVVISKSEKKATFIDLKPLFGYYRTMYFGSTADFQVTRNVGAGDSQWPRTFAAAPAQVPAVIRTVDLPERPTAVRTYAWGPAKRAWIATQEGRLRIFNLGDYPTEGTGSPASIQEIGGVTVGRNPTNIAQVKEKAGRVIYPDILSEVIVTSRGDRRVEWVRLSGSGGSVVRTLRDTRLADPIAAEDTDNHSTESYVLSVADYGGRQLSNYRYGPVIMWPYTAGSCLGPSGCGMAGEFEYGGSFALPGGAFQIRNANVP